ncbi:GDSL-type esterase/lipase family protein [Corynebacterium sputi]|uniref:GDSL-type esterase/lipase family protein n=1 Tax=Corynebacterium sputi TaxID=489915 RepID=UPI0003F65D64|nr:GDSL-type esterase/lipase family protein [Corynebacterium sputi]
MKKSFLRRAAAIVIASGTAVGATIFGVTAATAATNDYVSFGDSFPANPGQTDAVAGKMCPVSHQNVGHKVREKTSLNLKDYSCNGTVVYMPNTPEKILLSQVEAARANNDLKDASLVTFFVGANDAMQSFPFPSQIQQDLYLNNMNQAVETVRAEAPNAKIVIVGYPEFIGTENQITCPINVAGFAPHVPAGPVKFFEDNLQDRQAAVAEANGVQFLDMKQVANVEAGLCATEGGYVSAFIDSNVGEYNMPVHLTHTGSDVFANEIVKAYNS